MIRAELVHFPPRLFFDFVFRLTDRIRIDILFRRIGCIAAFVCPAIDLTDDDHPEDQTAEPDAECDPEPFYGQSEYKMQNEQDPCGDRPLKIENNIDQQCKEKIPVNSRSAHSIYPFVWFMINIRRKT